MKKNKKIPECRIETDLFCKMQEAINTINSSESIQLSQTDFIRLALKSFSEQVLREGLVISIKPKDKSRH